MKWNETTKAVALGVLLPVILLGITIFLTEDKPENTVDTPTVPNSSAPAPENPAVTDYKKLTVLHGGQLQEMQMDAYLTGVLLAEMPASFEKEALRAQSIASRTYALRCCEDGIKHGAGVICTEYTCCQAYMEPRDYVAQGGTWESVERIAQAVADTRGLVVKYDGRLIQAAYFSCSGGQTEDAVAVWGQSFPYLQSVASPGEEATVFYTDSKSFTAQQLQAALGIMPKGPVGTWFGKVSYTPGGGVDTMDIGGVRFRGTTLRSLLGLRSTAFTVSVANGVVTFQTKGYGHRVGMSQYGANAMAKEGKNFRQILLHYYGGVEIVECE